MDGLAFVAFGGVECVAGRADAAPRCVTTDTARPAHVSESNDAIATPPRPKPDRNESILAPDTIRSRPETQELLTYVLSCGLHRTPRSSALRLDERDYGALGGAVRAQRKPNSGSRSSRLRTSVHARIEKAIRSIAPSA